MYQEELIFPEPGEFAIEPAAEPGSGTESDSDPALSVSEALQLAKGALERVAVTIRGEISEFSDKPGYKAVYFTITDESSALSCLIWRNVFQRQDVQLRQGALVEVSGVFSLYAAKGRMNFEVRTLRLAGEGDLRVKVAQLARKLATEGLMDAERKLPLPQFPGRIAVVTSPRGKAVHDVLRTLRRRYPLAEVLLCGVPVEGDGAPRQIIAGLEAAVQAAAEVILLVRGGGSYEDLMPFNDETLARAIASSPIPIVTGIGHEPDNSIADMVASYRASTPTAAAERVAPNIAEITARLTSQSQRLGQGLRSHSLRLGTRIAALRQARIFMDCEQLFKDRQYSLEAAGQRLSSALESSVSRAAQQQQLSRNRLLQQGRNLLAPAQAQLRMQAAQLQGLSPLAVLARGYSVAYDRDGHVISSIDAIDLCTELVLRVSDGQLGCLVQDKQPLASAPEDPEDAND
ncbi:MAG: exodeoxyribonuclease VII large subunit [Coriobacteriales bacterium]|jgi:exodeoxyribonuclease VII large subunit|nr:exodeoxyribonuclease VII large subunit [Coriobacteriales bacterium]